MGFENMKKGPVDILCMNIHRISRELGGAASGSSDPFCPRQGADVLQIYLYLGLNVIAGTDRPSILSAFFQSRVKAQFAKQKKHQLQGRRNFLK